MSGLYEQYLEDKKTKSSSDTSGKTGLYDQYLAQKKTSLPSKEPVITIPKIPSAVSKIVNAPVDTINAGINAVGKTFEKATGRVELTDPNAQSFWKQLPSSTIESLPFGVGEVIKQIRDNPEAASQLTAGDLIKAVPKVGLETIKGLTINPLLDLAGIVGGELKFNIPGLGEVSNLQYQTAESVRNGENPYMAVLKAVPNAIFDTLSVVAMGQKVFSPRPTVIGTGGAPEGVTVQEAPKSFRLYENPIFTKAMPEDFVSRIVAEKGIKLTKAYDPKLPTYFRMTTDGAGNIISEVIQIKPSYFDTFINKFGGDTTKVPNEAVNSIYKQETSIKAIEEAKPIINKTVPPVGVTLQEAPVETIQVPPTETSVNADVVNLVEQLHKDAFGDSKAFDKLVKETKKVGLRVEEGESEGATISFPYSVRKSMSINEAADIFSRIINEKSKITDGDYSITPNPDGTLSAYHGTSAENAKSILKNGAEDQLYLSPTGSPEAGGVGGAGEYTGDSGKILKVTFDPREMEYNGLGEIKVPSEAILSIIDDTKTWEYSVQVDGKQSRETLTTTPTKEHSVTPALIKLAEEGSLSARPDVNGKGLIYKKVGSDEVGNLYEPLDDYTFPSIKEADDFLVSLSKKSTTQSAKNTNVPTKDGLNTARGVAKDLIRAYVERGDSLKSLKDGQGGTSNQDYSATIGGFLNGKKFSSDKILVKKIKDKEVNEFFSLKEIFNEILEEKKAKISAEIVKPKTEKVIPKVTEVTPKISDNKANKPIDNQPLPVNNQENGNINQSDTLPRTSESPTGEVIRRNIPTNEQGTNGATGEGEFGAGLNGGKGDGKRVGKKTRQEINTASVSILTNKNFSTNAGDYSAEDLDILSKYSGAGGKEKAGAEGVGLLSEYYTNDKITDKLWEVALHYIKPNSIYEPSVGTGNIIKKAPIDAEVGGTEYQKISGTIAKIFNPRADITIGNGEGRNNPGDFQSLFFDEATGKEKPMTKKYDLIIGNPPFGDRSGYQIGRGEEKNIKRWEQYFIKRGLDLLNDGGILAYVVNSSFLDNGGSPGKNEISKIGELIDAYRLPEGLFDDTQIGTDIVVFIKRDGGVNVNAKNKIVDNNWFEAYPEKVLGVIKTRRGRYGDQESFVEGEIKNLEQLNLQPSQNQLATNKQVKPKSIIEKPKIEILKDPNKAPTVRQTQKTVAKEGKVKHVFAPTPETKKIETIKSQELSNRKYISELERKVFENIDRNGNTIPVSGAEAILNYSNGVKTVTDDINYYSGDIYAKLDQLAKDKDEIIKEYGQKQYDKQFNGLTSIVPLEKTIDQIQWGVSDLFVKNQKTGDGSRTVLSDFRSYIQGNSIVTTPTVSKYDVMDFVAGNSMRQGTRKNLSKIQDDAKRLFNKFIRTELNKETQDALVKQFNQQKNGYVRPLYNQLPVKVENMSADFRGGKFLLSPVQKDGVSFLINKGSGLIAYGVGVGKTHTLLVATIANMQLGNTKRPIFTVPNSTILSTWIPTMQQMFPTMTFVNLGGLTLPDIARLKKERGDIKNWLNDGEIGVLSHEGLLKIGLSEEELTQAVGDLTDALVSRETEAVVKETKRGKVKKESDIQAIIGSLQGDTSLMFSDLGIDHISVDEVHNFRKVFKGAKKEVHENSYGGKARFANTVGGEPSKAAQKLFILTQFIQKNNGGRNVFLASATPFENQATEVYNVLSFVARDRMKEMGITNINDFLAIYADFKAEEVVSLGEIKTKDTMKNFANVSALQELIKEFIDYQIDDTLVRPERKVLTPQLAMSPLQIEYAAKVQEVMKSGRDAAQLVAMTHAITNSVSPLFIKEFHPQSYTPQELIQHSPKIKYAVEIAIATRENPKTSQYGTFIYMGKYGIESGGQDKVAQYLVENGGFKPSEVAVLNGATPRPEREVIKENFNSGKVKVLIGGDPTKEGIDLQKNGFATINLALGWNPTEPAQVEGRIWRQGNNRSIAPLIYPLVENSGDPIMYQKFSEKGSRINDLFSYKGDIFDVGEVDPEEKKMILTTDPIIKANLALKLEKGSIEVDLVNVQTQIKDLQSMESRITEETETRDRVTKNLSAGVNRYSLEPLTAEEKTALEEQLARVNARIKIITDKMKRLDVTDITKSIEDLRTQETAIQDKLDRVNETLPQKIKKFQDEFAANEANRKSIKDHIADFSKMVNESLVERTPQEITQIRQDKIRELQEKEARATAKFETAPSGNASIGGYIEGEPVTMGNIDKIRPVEMPELVELATEIMGQAPTVKKMRKALGLFKEIGRGQIKLDPRLFEEGNTIQLAKVLAHEIGHLTDYVPDLSMKHGSLKSRILVVRNHLIDSFGESVKNKEFKAELIAMSKIWRPSVWESQTPSMKIYRESGKELYADAISVLLTNPGLLEQTAPKFYKAFFESLDNKPEINEKYWELQDRLSGAKEELYKAREARIKKGFQRAIDIQQGFLNKKDRADKRLLERLRQQLDDRYYPILKKVQEAEARGVIVDDSANPKYLLQNIAWASNDNYLLVEQMDREVSKPIKEAGMSDDDIGQYLLLNRIATERAEIANPFGFTPQNATEQLDHIKTRVGEENYKLLQDKIKIFHDIVFKSVEKAVEVGSYNKELFNTKIKPNKENYAAFRVVDYMQDYVPATVKKQMGTLKEVANPYFSTILKTAALNKLNIIQEAKNSTIKLLTDTFPSEIKPTKTITSDGKLKVFVGSEDVRLKVLEDGKLKSYDVDPYIAKSFEHDDPDNVNVIINLLQTVNQKFKSLVTTYNLGFAVAFNPIRDIKRNYKLIPNATVGNVLSAYIQSLPSAYRFSKGQLDAFTRQLVADRAMNAPMGDYNADPTSDEMGILLEKFGLLTKTTPESELPATMAKARKFLLKPLIKTLEGIRFTANTFEVLSKIAGAKIRIAGGESGAELISNVRNYTGTPNYKVRGTQTATTNEVFIFSNIMKEGLKSDYEIATNPKTRSGYWWKTAKVDLLPKFLMFLASAGLFGAALKKMFDDMSEYDKSNYITIPIGDQNGKTQYIRIPHDETGRLISATMWKSLNFMNDQNISQAQDIFSFGAGQLPSVTPVITILTTWGQYLSGRNPYDAFRGRMLIDDTTFKAGGTAGLKKMVQWTTNTFGLTSFATYDNSSNTTFENIVQMTPVVDRVFKISNYGQTEKNNKILAEVNQKKARATLDQREIINNAVKDNREGKSIEQVKSDALRSAFGGQVKTKAEIAAFRKKIDVAIVRGQSDPNINSLISATSVDAQVALLKDYKKTMSKSDFADIFKFVQQQKIISKNTAIKSQQK